MIEVNKKYCPVCLVGNGYGVDAPYDDSSSFDHNEIQPCRYPWQTPIGILKSDVLHPEFKTDQSVQRSGTFDLHYSAVLDDTDIYGVNAATFAFPTNNSIRVYYQTGMGDQANQGMYVVENVTNINHRDVAPINFIGNYPGAATIGYIQKITPETNYSGTVTIVIDPRPARSKYRVANGSSTNMLPGTPVTILSDNTALSYSSSTHASCDGVVAGYIWPYTSTHIVKQLIVCTSGPAWCMATADELYAVCNYDDIIEEKSMSKHVPIDANLALIPIDIGDAPRIGYVHWPEWYDPTDNPDNYMMIIDVDPEYPTIGDYENANHASDGVIVAP